MASLEHIQTSISNAYPSRMAPTAFAVFFARKERVATLAMLTALAACVVAGLSLFLTLGALNQEVQFVVMDPSGGIFLARGRSFDRAKELHVEQALLASTALSTS